MTLTFEEWENKADKYMVTKYGVGIDDIPDMPWYDWYSLDLMYYKDAAELAIQKVNKEGF